jgi:DNA-binding protein YbaB
MSAEFDQLVAEFEKFQSTLRRADDQLADVALMQSELSALEVSVTSPDRTVTVLSGVGGSIKDIQFTEGATQLGPQRLGSVVMTAVREAVAEAARRQASIVQQYAGGDAPVLDQVLETQAQVTGVSVEELRAKVEQEAPPRRMEPVGEEEQSVVFRDSTPPPPQAAGDAADSFLKSVWDEEDH